MRSLATVQPISTDTYKKLVNKGGTTSGWVAEKGSRAETDTPTLSEIVINTKELYAQPAATQTLLDDSRVDIGQWLANEVVVEFDEQEGDAFISGNGVEKPKGIAAYTMVANTSYAWGKVGFITSGHASLLNNLDKLISLQHALKPQYRNGASWLTNDSVVEVLRTFKNGNGEYMWRQSLMENAPDIFLGKPVVIDDNIDDIGANKFPIFYANFKRAYLIVDRMGTRVLRDPYTSKPYVLFYTTKRVGGGITMYEAIKCLKIAA
jgi:HK97 family phage major capsid protein